MPEAAPAEQSWSDHSPTFRLDLLKRFAAALVTGRESVLQALAGLRPHSSRAELLTSELMPLLDNIAFLRSEAQSLLKPAKLGRRGQPVWLFGVDTVIYREPVGRVLILAPGNYPLFLPIVQACYAWAAGNAVWLKSAPGSLPLHDVVRDLFLSVGGPPEIFRLLGESEESFPAALAEGVDKVVLVGSAATGEAVLAQAGRALVPCLAELSGWDAVLIHPQANLEQAAAAIAFGLGLNAGRTCVAPRRIFFRGDIERFEQLLESALRDRPSAPLSPGEQAAVADAVRAGARAIGEGPVVLSRVGREHRMLREPQFGALAVLYVSESDDESLQVARSCPYALGAALFGPLDWANGLVHQVPAQVVCVNDMIVPSADPRLPFGGSGRSGFGRMRGREGLLEMTRTRSVSVRQGGTTDHLRAPTSSDGPIVERFLLLAHGPGLGARARALASMLFLIGRERVRRRRARRESVSESAL